MTRHPAPAAALDDTAARLRVLVGRLYRRLRKEVPVHGLTWAQATVLGYLDRDGPTTAAALAAAEGVRPQSMAATIEALEAAGLVERRADPADRRRLVVCLAARGRREIKASRRLRDTWLADALGAALDADEQRALGRALELLERLVAP